MAKIQVTEGTYTSGDVDLLHLASQHILNPEEGIDKIIMYTEKRWLMTLLVSGVTDSRYTAPRMFGKDTAATKIPVVPEGELMDGIAWKYRIMGRIQKPVEIIGQIGVSTNGTQAQGGTFTLSLKTNDLKPGMNVIFYNGKQARVQGMPTGGAGNYIHRFQCYPGDTFVLATWVTVQPGTKTCFGGYTTYGERSVKGYDTMHYPDMYISHMTTQRKGFSISGDANAQKIYIYDVAGVGKGFVFEEEAQARSRFLQEDEFQKWWGKSTMKDSLGNLLNAPSMTDEESGQPIYAGDGCIEQIAGSNDMEASGTDGLASYDDFVDMVKVLKKKANQTMGNKFIAVTGSDGMQNAHNVCATYAANYHNIQYQKTSNSTIGGDDIPIGYWFTTLNIAGNQIIFVENPMMDDDYKFPRRLSNGNLAMSCTYYFLDFSSDDTGRRNIEIRARGRQGVNRNMVIGTFNGMTGQGVATSSVDAYAFEMLKQNCLIVRNVKTCGIIAPSATA